MVSEKLGAAFVEVGADLSPLEKSLGSIPGMMHNAGTNITGGLKASLQGGNFTDVGKQLGNQLVTGMTSQFGMLGQAAGTFATALGPAGIALLGIGASVAAIGVGLGKCVSSAATWQDLMVDVQKVTTTTEAGFSKLSSDLLAIRGSTGASMEDIAGAAAGAGRMGIAPEEIADYTEVILKMSSAWGVSADASSDAIGKIGAAVKPAEMAWADFANRSGSLINDLADTTVTSEAAIIQGLSKLTGSMKDFKVQPDQLAGWASMVAYLQEMGDTDVGAGEHIKDALREITKTTHGEDIAALIGVDFGELQEMIRTDTIGTFELLAAAIADLPLEEQGDAFALFGDSGAEAMKKFAGGVDETTGSISRLGEIAATGNSAWENATSLNEQYAKSQETLNAQIEIFKGKISVAAVSIGSVLLPHLTQMMQDINGITQALMDLGAKGWKWLYGGVDDEGAETQGAIGRLTGWMDEKLGIEYGAKLGEEMAGEIEPAVTGAVEDGLEEADGTAAGRKVGQEFTDEFKKSLDSMHAAGMRAVYEGGQIVGYESRSADHRYQYGETFTAGGSTVGLRYEKGGQVPWLLTIGDWVGAFGSPEQAREYISRHFLALDSLISPEQWEIAWKSARLKTTGTYDDPGDVARLKAGIELAAELDRVIDEQVEAYKDAIAKAMDEGVIIDWMTAWEDAGEEAAKVFADNLVSGMEAQDMVDRLEVLELYDPAKFEEMGGEAALSWWQGLTDLLEKRADLKAVDIKADTSEIDNQIADAIKSGEPYLATIKANVELSAFGGVKAESLVTQLSVGDLMKKVLGGEQLSAYIGRPDVWKEEVLLPARFEELKQWKEYYDTGWLRPEANVEFANSILELRDAQECLFLAIEDAPIQEYKAISEEHRTGADAVKMLSELYKVLDGAMNKNKDTTTDYGDELDKLTHELSTACECASDWAKWQENPVNNMFAKSVVTNTQSYVDRIKELAAEGLATETQIRYAAEQELEQNRIDELAEDLLGVGRTTIQTFLECDTSAAEESIESMSTMAEETRTMPLNVDSTGPLEAIRVIDAAAAQPITKLIYLQCLGCVGALGGGLMGGSITFTSGGGLGAVESQYPGITESPGWGTPSWLPVLDSGGLVSGPTLAMLAANAKPEVVAPLDSLFTILREAVGNKSGGNTFNIVVHEAVNAEETAELVTKKIAESEERIAVAYRNRTKGATYRSSQTTYFGTAGL